MELAMVGLGRMGANMARRLLAGKHRVLVYDLDPGAVEPLAQEGASPCASLEDLTSRLTAPRIVWCMLPAGGITEEALLRLGPLLSPGDILIDGGNSHFKDDIRRAAELAKSGIDYVDVGTSGGVWGAERGYCLMVGGSRSAFERLQPVLETLAPGMTAAARTPGRAGPEGSAERGFLHCGPAGAGHFVKMVHNGIEYGLMQAYAEGLELLKAAGQGHFAGQTGYDFNVEEIAELWRRGSVVGSWLLDLLAMALLEDPGLERYSGFVQDSGEGRWTLNTAVDLAVPVPSLTAALYTRFRSRESSSFAERTLSAMREKFGGHRES